MSGGADNKSVAAGSSGSSQRSQSRWSTTSGMRSWISASSPTASVVMMVQLSSGAASFSGRHTDHRPAMNSGSPSARYMKNGVLRAFLPAGVSGLGFHS